MPLEGHWERQNATLVRLGARERRVLIAGAALSIVLVALIAFSALVASDPSAPSGCRRVVVPMSTGGAAVYRCPATAGQAVADR